MTRTRTLVVLALGVALASLSGCGSRATIRPDHGESTRAWKAKQRVNPTPAEGKPAGLDSEEAATIHAAYKDSLGGGGKSSNDSGSRVMILSDDGGGSRDKGGSYKK